MDDFVSKIRLKDSKESIQFRPLKVSSSMNAILKPIIEAFDNADKVAIGYSTLEKGKGLVKPKLKKKNLYLTGGALRDHLKGKTFKNYDLVTDATPDEIILILKKAKNSFKHIMLKKGDLSPSHEFYYYPSKYDENNKVIEVVIERNGQKAFIATLSTTPKHRHKAVKSVKFTTSVELDAKNRDLTINALYLKLKNSDGDNSELIDPVGGAHDLKTGQIITCEPHEKSFSRHEYLPFRLAKICSIYSDDNRIPEKYLSYISDNYTDFDMNPSVCKDMFLSAIDDMDIPLHDYLQNLVDSNMIYKLFPHCEISDIKEDLPNNKITLISYLLCKNGKEKIQRVLSDAEFKNSDIEEILNLIQLANKHKLGADLSYIRKITKLSDARVREFLALFDKSKNIKKIGNYIEDDLDTNNLSDINLQKFDISRYIKRNN